MNHHLYSHRLMKVTQLADTLDRKMTDKDNIGMKVCHADECVMWYSFLRGRGEGLSIMLGKANGSPRRERESYITWNHLPGVRYKGVSNTPLHKNVNCEIKKRKNIEKDSRQEYSFHHIAVKTKVIIQHPEMYDCDVTVDALHNFVFLFFHTKPFLKLLVRKVNPPVFLVE